jgi:hypothetical protein
MPSAGFPTTALGWLVAIAASIVGLVSSVWFMRLAEGLLS